jgi:hypothetical protein
VSAAPLPDPVLPTATPTEHLEIAGTAGERERDDALPPIAEAPRVRSAAPVVPPSSSLSLAEAIEPPPPVRMAEPPRPTLEPVTAAEPPAAVAASTFVPPRIETPVPPRTERPDDSGLVKQVLQRYRSAYEGLDARSAQAVWPAVNEAALARAFDGLESQSLSFEACEVRVRGEAATAICHGSARYVPKIGNRDPRVEPRVWSFTLHKIGSDWKIDSARAER